MEIKSEKSITTHSPDITRTLGELLGKKAYAGMVLTLNGDLGCGKTTFTQGVARGLGIPTDYHVTSPTYTLINEYPGRHRLFHVDLYRLSIGADLEDIGIYDILDGDQVVVIEWADRMLPEDLPKQRVDIKFRTSGTKCREILLTAYGLEATNLLNGIDISGLAPDTPIP